MDSILSHWFGGFHSLGRFSCIAPSVSGGFCNLDLWMIICQWIGFKNIYFTGKHAFSKVPFKQAHGGTLPNDHPISTPGRPAIHEARSLTGCDTTPQAAGFHGMHAPVRRGWKFHINGGFWWEKSTKKMGFSIAMFHNWRVYRLIYHWDSLGGFIGSVALW